MKRINAGYAGWFSDDNTDYCKAVAFCDINKEKLHTLSQQYPHIKMYENFHEFLKHPGLDAVIISTPNFLHAEQAIAAMEAGKDVFLEKPMGINREECDRILAAQKRTGKRFTVDFEMRVSTFPQRIKLLIRSGEYGELKRMEFFHHRGCWLEQGNGIWRTRPEKSGGLFFMETIHEVDIFRFFAGDVESVISVAGANVLPQYHFEDNAAAHLFFSNGISGSILTSHTHSAIPLNAQHWQNTAEYHNKMGHDMSFIFTLTKGSIGANMLTGEIMINRFEEYPRGSGGYRVIQDRIENIIGGNGMDEVCHDINKMRHEFLRRSSTDEPPVQDPIDIWKSHLACLAVEESIKLKGERVKLNYNL
jgi:predicted dehydrogenase